MPVRYAIQPDLDLLLYIFEGECIAREYFDMYHSIYLDKRRHHGMKVLIDISKATLDFNTQNLREATAIVSENKAGGFPSDRVAILTKDSSMQFLKDTLVLLADGIPMYLEVFHYTHDAIHWLGLDDMKDEVMHFRETCLQGKE